MDFSMDSKEYILCSAIHYNDNNIYKHQPKNITTGIIICGRRHHNCISTLVNLKGKENIIDIKKHLGRDSQGFLTNTDRFVSRLEAAKIAIAAEQLLYPRAFNPDNRIGLISEDVW
jgi:hypothetical protein